MQDGIELSRKRPSVLGHPDRIAVLAVLGKSLDEPKLLDVARDGRLRDIIPGGAKALKQVLLRIDNVVADKLENRCVAFWFHFLYGPFAYKSNFIQKKCYFSF